MRTKNEEAFVGQGGEPREETPPVEDELEPLDPDFLDHVRIDVTCFGDGTNAMKLTHLPTGLSVERHPLGRRSNHEQRDELLRELRRNIRNAHGRGHT